jgi:hypothetical protein
MFTATQCAQGGAGTKPVTPFWGIGRALSRAPTAVHRILQCTGASPGATIRAIARALNRGVSTVSQEVSRRGGRELYRAAEADLAAWDSASSEAVPAREESGVRISFGPPGSSPRHKIARVALALSSRCCPPKPDSYMPDRGGSNMPIT